MPTTRLLSLLAALLLLASLHTAHGQTAPEDSVRLVVQQGHTKSVYCVAYSPDGRFALSGSKDHSVRLWEVTTGREIRTFKGHTDEVYSVSFSPDGRMALSGSWKEMKLWDVATGREIRTFGGITSDVRSVAFSPDGRTALSGSLDQTVKLWDVATGQEILTFEGHTGPVRSVAFSHDGRTALSGSSDKTLKLWDVATGQVVRTFEGHKLGVNSVAFSPDGRTVISGSSDNSIKLWDFKTGSEVKTLRKYSSVLSISMSPNGKTLLSGQGDGTVVSWGIPSGEQYGQFGKEPKGVYAVSTSPSGQTAATYVSGGLIIVWDFATARIKNRTNGTGSVSYSPNKNYIITQSLMLDNNLVVIDANNGNKISILIGHSDYVNSVSLSINGEWALSGGDDQTLILWETKSGRRIHILKGHKDDVNTVSISPNNRLALSGSDDNTLILWDLIKGRKISTFIGHTMGVKSVAFSPDGQKAVSGSSDTDLLLWNVSDGVVISKLQGHESIVSSVAFDPNGKTVLSGAWDNTVKLWDVSDGHLMATLTGHADHVTSVCYTRNGLFALSGSEDGTIRLWDITTCKEIVSLIAVGDSTDYIARTPDGYYKTTKGGLQAVHYVKGLTVYPFENFDLKYNRPDIVLQRIGLAPQELIDAYYRAYKKRLKKMGFREEDLSGELHLPGVQLASKDLPYQTDQAAFKLPFTATDTKFTLDRINVFINDVPIYGTGGISLRGKDLSTLEQTLDLQLSAGENKIQVSVLNSAGVESLKETHYVTYTPATPTKPTLYVLSIGVSKYRQSQYNLTYAAKDARDIADYFRQNPGTYQEVKELVLTDGEATTENILAARQFLVQAGVDDQVLVFVAGHGLLDAEYNYYFGAHGIDFLNPQTGGLPYEDLEGLLDGLPCRKKLLLMDTCHSGEADEDDLGIATASDTTLPTGAVVFRNAGPGASKKEGQLGLKNSFELMNELFTDLRRGSGAHVISSAGGGEFALEGSEWQNGVFTYALLSGLKSGTADANQDGTITVSEIRSYVGQQVETLTRGAQRPTARQENLEYDFVLR